MISNALAFVYSHVLQNTQAHEQAQTNLAAKPYIDIPD